MFVDAKFLRVDVQKEVYGLFVRYSGVFNRLDKSQKKAQSIVPSLLLSNHPEGSVIHASGSQMWELKRVQSVSSFNSITGMPSGQNDFCRLRIRGHFVLGVDCRVLIRSP